MSESGANGIFYFAGDATDVPAPLSSRPEPVQASMDKIYLPDPALARAVNVALLLGMPLLLTGEPGVGKTRLVSHLAEKQHAPFESYTVTSLSTARDLLYGFDELRRMRDAFGKRGALDDAARVAELYRTLSPCSDLGEPSEKQGDAAVQSIIRSYEKQSDKESEPERISAERLANLQYVTFRALGRAILRAGGTDAPLLDLATGSPTAAGAPVQSFGDLFNFASDKARSSSDRMRTASETIDWDQPTVVLIDEIDKAPRDLPNDLLTELDRLQFDIPELGLRVALPLTRQRPVVVITSNSERALPEAFLRRCVYHHIEWPEKRLPTILDAHIGRLKQDTKLKANALAFIKLLRDSDRIEKKPGIAEVVQWLHLIDRQPQRRNLDQMSEDELVASLATLLKTESDLAAGIEMIKARPWLQSKPAVS